MLATHLRTPLIESWYLNQSLGRRVFFKLENLQPTGSFKDRGIGRLANQLAQDGVRHFISSSGGNAGLSAAYAGKRLGVPTTVVALNAISEVALDKLKWLGASVEKGGETWDEIHSLATNYGECEGHAYIHPFEHSRIWDGYAEIVKELHEQGPKPSQIVLAVGGGGLLSGVCQGLAEVGWDDVEVVAVETKGAASFHEATKAGSLVTLDRIHSVATTLGATRVSQQALECFKRHCVRSVVVEDRDAIAACDQFAQEQKMLVEPACGAALSQVYQLLRPTQDERDPVVVIVCGGSGVSWSLLEGWKKRYL